MFSPKIVQSDAFLDMPISTQALYFHLGMEADDDGFVNPKKTMRIIGASEDDLKVLKSKRFVLAFESGIVVIKHWLIHNLIRTDLYQETSYINEKNLLGLNENGSYTELREGISPLKKIEAPKWLKIRRKELRTANGPFTARRIGKDRIITDAKRLLKNMQKIDETKHSSDYEKVIESDTGQPPEIPRKIAKDKLALAVQKSFANRALKNLGTKPTWDSKGYFTVLKAIKSGMTPELLNQKIDDWFASGKPAEELISITRCFSVNSIDAWKVTQGIK